MSGVLAVLRRFSGHVRPYRRLLALGALLAVLEVVVRLAEPWPLRLVVDHALADDPSPVLGITDPMAVAALSAVMLLVVVALAAVLDYWSTRVLASAGLRLAADLRGTVFTHLHRLSLAFHGRSRVGDLANRVTSDVDRTQDMLVQSLAVIGPNVMLVVGMFAVMVAMDVVFALVALVLAPLLAWTVHRSTVRLKRTSRAARAADGVVAAAASESLAAMPLVQSLGLEPTQRRTFDRLAGESLRAGLESARIQARFSPLVDLTAAGSAAMVLWVGTSRVRSGEITLGMLLVFVSYLGSLYKPLKALSRLSTSLAKGAAAAERIEEVLGELPDVAEPARPVRPRRARGHLEFADVSLRYGSTTVLDGVSLEVQPGQTLALVGPTGAGKTSLASLVPRLVDPTSGAVHLDFVDVRRRALADLRSQVAVVLQDCLVMRGTLRDNIRLGDVEASDAAVRRAARLALVDEFASRLPDGLDTAVGERGSTLSGGQRQRLAIARAILRDAPVLVLDEPTSALDVHTEELVMEALSNLPEDRTTLLIAHRLSTIRSADAVAVLDRGRLVRVGSPTDVDAAVVRRLTAPTVPADGTVTDLGRRRVAGGRS
ncbi:ABC transporter ATP-binding protein [Arthrobacter sp. NEB 688]|uniref:ABC transporter ATP-binding protein n=1 Tax=Arthrobacter sp. NEB 688 TaxID=904039 RepID=UPI0015676DB4|nr:ABC transporter ATP-binding protein [Arthrobacter sp. NEB 688]QKE84488.1 ABC transporter ATP-binding protein [Arthrobacter sp. NEB 688]